jgi:hypothetical protein
MPYSILSLCLRTAFEIWRERTPSKSPAAEDLACCSRLWVKKEGDEIVCGGKETQEMAGELHDVRQLVASGSSRNTDSRRQDADLSEELHVCVRQSSKPERGRKALHLVLAEEKVQDLV